MAARSTKTTKTTKTVDVTAHEREMLTFDTESGDLRRLGVQLLRHSDPQPGWLLTAPPADLELTSGSRQRTVPVSMTRTLMGLTRGGDLVEMRSATTESTTDRLRSPETLGDLVLRYLTTQLDGILLGDLILRSGRPSVHLTRVAVRRARSTLKTFAPVVDAEAAAAFSTELRWYALQLGEVRDRDVLHDRLLGQIGALDEGDLLGPVASYLESTLASERGEHLRMVNQVLESERYAALLDAVERWRSAPPVTDRADRPAAKAQKLLHKAENTLDRRLADVVAGEPDLHPARKAAKRLRYAAELSEPVLGKAARTVVKRNKALQTLLGEHQDSVVSAAFLRRVGAAAGTSEGHNGYTYGLLAAHEHHRAVRIRDQVLRALGG